ncbi:MAG: NAD-binding protein [Armatimonadetes bacterium]|nr:NAD-binding protein [Armatimonadota bacterium]
MKHVIVCGLGRFGLRVVECLREQDAAARITVITNAGTRADRLKRARDLDVTLQIGDFRFDDVRADAGVTDATAFILASSQDADCLAAALDVRGDSSTIRILMRLDEGRIADRLMRDFGIDVVLSPPALAAREFARAALAPMEPGQGVPPPRFSVGAILDRMMRLPERFDGRYSLLVLAGLFLFLFGAGVIIFRRVLGISTVDALYFTSTILTTVGFGDYNLLKQGDGAKLFGAFLMFAGVTLTALLTSFTTNFFLSGTAGRLRTERLAARMHNHVIVCGLGSVGYEIVRDLTEQNVSVVVIDRSADSASVRQLEGRVPVIIGDAATEEALCRAGIEKACTVIACLSDDGANLEIGLTAQTLVQDRGSEYRLRLILRCFDADLARRINAVSSDYVVLSSAEIAAPVFAREALAQTKERENTK